MVDRHVSGRTKIEVEPTRTSGTQREDEDIIDGGGPLEVQEQGDDL